MNLVKVQIGDLSITTADQLDGYGYKHLNDFLTHIVSMSGNRPVKKALDWCSGPGYIGFGLREIDYAEQIVLSDIHTPLEEIANRSIVENNCEDSMQFICSDNFKNISAQKFDLIVGNPPHFNYDLPYTEEAVHYEEHRKHMDMDWKCHIDFYNNVKDYLAPNGQIILMENVKGSSATLFYDMIRKNGLRIVDHKTSTKWPNDIWYIKVVHAD